MHAYAVCTAAGGPGGRYYSVRSVTCSCSRLSRGWTVGRRPSCHLNMMRSAALLLARTDSAVLSGHAAVRCRGFRRLQSVQTVKVKPPSHTHSPQWLERVTARRNQRFSSPSSQENAPRHPRLVAAEADLASLESTWQLLRPAGPGVCVYLQEVERFLNDTNLDFDWLVSTAASRLHVVGECGVCVSLLHLWLPWTCLHQRICPKKS